MADALTKKQRKLRKELEEIAETIGIDYWNILDREAEARTPVLEVVKRQLVRGEIVDQYTLIDDLLAMKVCEYFFPGNRGMIRLWKTQRFKRFNFYVLEHLYLVHKLALVKGVYQVPKTIASTMEEINALRNGLAHAFFPENLRVYQRKGRPAPRKPVAVLYKGVDIFTLAGIQRFTEDASAVYNFLLWQIKRRKRPKKITLARLVTDPAAT